MDPEARNYDPDAKKEDGSCKYEEKVDEAPKNYSFSDARLSPGRVRIELLDRLKKEVAKGRNGSSIALQDLMDIYRNNGVAGSGVLEIENTLSTSDSSYFESILQEIAARSGTPSSMVAGYFVSSDSIAYVPLIEKGLMSASFFRYSTEVLLEDLENASHSEPEGSSPTQREELFDEAFSTFGAPRDFSRSTPFGSAPDHEQGAWFWGASCLRTDSATGDLPAFFDAWVEARWALTHEKSDRRKDAVRKVERGWERIAGALLIRHIKRTIGAIDRNETGERIFHWSNAHAILRSATANSDGIMDPNERQTLRSKLGSSPNNTDIPALNDALPLLQNIYGFSNNALQAL